MLCYSQSDSLLVSNETSKYIYILFIGSTDPSELECLQYINNLMMEGMFCYLWLLTIMNDIFTEQNFKAWSYCTFS